jgi:hypothetical protein
VKDPGGYRYRSAKESSGEKGDDGARGGMGIAISGASVHGADGVGGPRRNSHEVSDDTHHDTTDGDGCRLRPTVHGSSVSMIPLLRHRRGHHRVSYTPVMPPLVSRQLRLHSSRWRQPFCSGSSADPGAICRPTGAGLAGGPPREELVFLLGHDLVRRAPLGVK